MNQPMHQMASLPVQGPISQQDMLIAMRARCPMCGSAFECGDRWAAMPRGPRDAEEAKKAEQGLPFKNVCEPVHYDCVVGRLVFVMNWYRRCGVA